MDENGAETAPLLQTQHHQHSKNETNETLSVSIRSSAKWALKVVMWAVYIAWAGLILLYPAEFTNKLFGKFIAATDTSLFGITGSLLLAFAFPVFALTILGSIYLSISDDDDDSDHAAAAAAAGDGYNRKWVEEKSSRCKGPRFRLWTFPVLVDGPFGVVSAGELIGIVVVYGFVVWAVSSYTLQNWSILPKDSSFSPYIISSVMFELEGLRFGLIGLFCLALLFIPVSRGSVLLRLVDIPFEHATKYHVWLGHLTMLIFTLHGLFYVIAWTMQGRLLEQILEWKDVGVANLAGVISLGAGLFMWVTSLEPVRKRNFELFFYTHQLYIVFVVFLALHVGDFIFSIAAGGIFIFMLDRFLRFCQSRKTVEILSATSLPCDTVELVISKPSNLRYSALSFVFLQVRELSMLQWHPFSVSSSPLDGDNHLSILIKVLGSWTDELRKRISNHRGVSDDDQVKLLSSPSTDRPQLTASVEGPYGHKSPYYLKKYKHLILVAGGIGISPFLAVLRDIIHRVNEGRPCMTRQILVVWAIKKSKELPLLSFVATDSVRRHSRQSSNALDIKIQIYVTRESEPSLEDGNAHDFKAPSSSWTTSCPFSKNASGGMSMSPLVGTGDNIWSGAYNMLSIIGFVVILGLLDVYYINPFDIECWWYKGLLFLGCMVASVVIVGGSVIFFWSLWCKRTSSKKDRSLGNGSVNGDGICGEGGVEEKVYGSEETYISSSEVKYGSRPEFKGIFRATGEQWGNVDVGVLVCGPACLQSSVAEEIRSHNLRRRAQQPVFHFNSHSFDL